MSSQRYLPPPPAYQGKRHISGAVSLGKWLPQPLNPRVLRPERISGLQNDSRTRAHAAKVRGTKERKWGRTKQPNATQSHGVRIWEGAKQFNDLATREGTVQSAQDIPLRLHKSNGALAEVVVHGEKRRPAAA
jgi:hypothetical protein